MDYAPFSINAKDGSSFTVDPTISLKIVDGKSAEVFKKYRKEDITEVINTTLYNYVQMTSGLQYPQTLVNAIDAKNAADGEAQALKIKGDAEAEYNRKIAASLSPLIVQQMMLDKWDGKLPIYGTVPTLFKDITGK